VAYAHNCGDLLIALQVSDGDKKSPRQISRTTHDTLADIFKKIGSKENTREVCNHMYCGSLCLGYQIVYAHCCIWVMSL